MPNYGGTMPVNGVELTYSYLELSKPTGKYISQVILRILNMLLKKGFFRHLGNPCLPGVDMPVIDPVKGKEQFGTYANSCGLLLANVSGKQFIKDGIVVSGEPFMVIPINTEWTNFEDYKASLTSKYRIRTNRVYALSEGVTKRNLNDAHIDTWILKCSQLLFDTIKNKTITIGNDLALIMQSYHKVLQDKYQLTGYFQGENLIGFMGSMIDTDTIYAMHLGYDIAVGTPLHLYQRMMYDTIAYSIEKKVSLLNLGRTAPEIKSTLGAIPVENSFVFFSRSRIFTWLLKLYAKRYHKTPSYVLRHPFKNK